MYVLALFSDHILHQEYLYLGLLAVAYPIVGYGVIKQVFVNVKKGNLLDENFLMFVATVGAIFVGEYPEAVGVMLFYNIGEYLEGKAVDKSRKDIEELMNIKPEQCNLLVDGEVKVVSPESVKVGDIIVVKVGEKVALDGVVVKGETRLDTSAITGESVLRGVSEGDEITSGVINKNSVIEVRVTKLFKDSTVSKIIDMVENATSKKSHTENFITVFARYYTPIVVASAVLVALVPPLLFGQDFSVWFSRGLIFLVVSCPCALVLSIPLSYFSGIGVCSREGILVKGSNYLEALKNVDTVMMDKTGTITKGVFEVVKVNVAEGCKKEELLKYAKIAESNSNHPIANSIAKYCKDIDDVDIAKIDKYEEISAHGVAVEYDGKTIYAGNERLMKSRGIEFPNLNTQNTKVYIACDNKFLGSLEISDVIKPGMKDVINNMKKVGIKTIVMLTGDSEKVACDVSNQIGIKDYYSQLLPNDKVEIVEKYMNNKKEKSNIAFIGDGINDAPVIARADVGISMGGIGSDAAIEASDVVFMTDEVGKIVQGKLIAMVTSKIVWQNIILAIGIKISVLVLSVFGLTNMWVAIFADVGVAILAVLNSLRILNYKSKLK